ncbi:hypothetical protein MPH_05247 [Macrophomina phaseolina MS6]|uniref:Short-chain dehydrogenase/reductase SDR n=1 Tax=Macrophomina phaseolina (strain MS6) TaxID=1126212 RepID=K2SL79_MACPH|nr:hypothetical protein MPH_05247 [Macrophomina phaseolina MS6]
MRPTAEEITRKHPDVAVRTVQLDPSSLASVHKAADEVVEMQNRDGVVIDVLMLNAGAMASPYAQTQDGFESQFGTNHLGHFFFANRIIPDMLGAGGKPRVISVSSEGHRFGPIRFADIGFQRTPSPPCRLRRSFGAQGLLALSLHPGAIMTNLGRHIDVQGDDMQGIMAAFECFGNPREFPEYWETHPFKTADEGTSAHVVAAFGDALAEHNGAFLRDAHLAEPYGIRPWARDPVEAERLWKVSEEMVGEKFDFKCL